MVKKEHYVPQFYLRHFSLDGKNIAVYDKQADKLIEQAPILSQAQKPYFYDLPLDGLKQYTDADLEGVLRKQGLDYETLLQNKQYIELFMSKIESETAEIFREMMQRVKDTCNNPWRMKNCVAISDAEKMQLSYFFAVQYARTLARRNLLEKVIETIYPKLFELYAAKYEWGRAFLRDIEAMGESMQSPFQCKVNPNYSKLIHIKLLLDEDFLCVLANCFYVRKWAFYLNDSNSSFLTSDDPVVLYRMKKAEEIWDTIAPADPNTGIFFAISDELLLNMIFNDEQQIFPHASNAADRGYELIDRRMANTFNDHIIGNASRMVYSNNMEMLKKVQDSIRANPTWKEKTIRFSIL